MITPEQVMEELQYYISEFGMDYYIEIKNGKHFPVTTAYLSQQEIKDKLLGLYRKRDSNIDHLTCSQIAKLDDEIDKLEKELVDVEVGEVFYTTFLEGNPIYITGRGLVYTSDKVMEIGDWIVDELSGKTYEIVAIEKRRVMMSPSKVVPPFGYVLRLCYISIMEGTDMSKEIKALNGLAQFIIMNDTGTDESASAIEWHNILTEALERVKKVEELLELYRYVWKTPILSQTISFEEAINRIDKLEEELK